MSRRIAIVCAILLMVVIGAGAQPRTLVLDGGTVIDGTGRQPLANAVIVIEGSRIVGVGQKGSVSFPSNATVIRTDGRTILPGLIDGHVHLRDWQVPMFLPYGITTIADLHNDTAWSIAQREALKTGRIRGPRLFVSGARVTGPLGPVEGDARCQIAHGLGDGCLSSAAQWAALHRERQRGTLVPGLRCPVASCGGWIGTSTPTTAPRSSGKTA